MPQYGPTRREREPTEREQDVPLGSVATTPSGVTAKPVLAVPVEQPDPLTGCAPWAILLLSRVQDGEPVDQARYRSGSKVSPETIHRYGQQHPGWYRLLMDAQAAISDGRQITPPEIARARSRLAVNRMADIAMGEVSGADGKPELVYHRDQISAARLVLEVGGYVGAQAAQGASGQAPAIQIAIVVTQGPPPPPPSP